jgi:hypothetical protein
MHNKRIFFSGVVRDSIPVSHFSIAEDVGDCLAIEPYFSPLWEISFHRGHQNSSVGRQMHVAFLRLSNILHQVSIAKNNDAQLFIQ